MLSYLVLLFLPLVFQHSCQVSTPSSSSYMAAVVEFSPDVQPRPENMMVNVGRYREFVKTAKEQDVDIIVFPELGLAGYGHRFPSMFSRIPEPDGRTVPCDGDYNTTEELQELSCIARDNRMYLVVNIPEQVPCTTAQPGCPSNHRFQYNCNVVFDRKGAVVARYRKFHLFGETGMNITDKPEFSVFETDFGVKFGTFVCFDLMFEEPAVKLVTEHQVTDIAFTTAWFSELPFLTATQAQAAWAHSHDVNFLGAGYNDPTVGSGGSGVYAGTLGPLQVTMPETKTSLMLVQEVPKKAKREGFEVPEIKLGEDANLMFLKSDAVEVYQSELLNVELGHGAFNRTLCSHGLCCDIYIDYVNSTVVSHYYRAVVFSGVRTFDGVATGGVELCGVIWCRNEELSSCATRSTSFDYTFKEITITGRFQAEQAEQIPSTLTKNLFPMMSSQFVFSSVLQEGKNTVNMKLQQSLDQLSTFAIYGRDFNRDGEPVTTGAAAQHLLAPLLIILTCIYSRTF